MSEQAYNEIKKWDKNIDETLKGLELWGVKQEIPRVYETLKHTSPNGAENDPNVLANQELGSDDNTSPLIKSEFKLNSVDQQASNLQSSLSSSGFEDNSSNLSLLGEQPDCLKVTEL